MDDMEKMRDELKNQVTRMRRLGDYDANAAVIRQLAECSLALTERMIAVQQAIDSLLLSRVP